MPYKHRKDNLLEIFNESTILLASYSLTLFINQTNETSTDSNLKDEGGWFLIGLVLFNLCVNTYIMIMDTIRSITQFIKKIIKRLKEK